MVSVECISILLLSPRVTKRDLSYELLSNRGCVDGRMDIHIDIVKLTSSFRYLIIRYDSKSVFLYSVYFCNLHGIPKDQSCKQKWNAIYERVPWCQKIVCGWRSTFQLRVPTYWQCIESLINKCDTGIIEIITLKC